jgi:peptidoglycan glycosyltransferase
MGVVLYPRQFERRVVATGNVSLVILGVFFVALAYWQVFRTDLAQAQYNPRIVTSFNDPHRGRILDRNGNVLASSLPSGQRSDPDPSLAHEVGYIDSRFGSTGAELAFNSFLSGRSGAGSWSAAFSSEFSRTERTGLDVRLTIDPAIQRAAAQALGSRTGAVVALDPRTGEVLAMVSVPTFDPGAIATNGDQLVKDPTSPLLNRATQGLYPPGSTFKTVTAISALENGVMTPQTSVTCSGQYVVDGFPISCNNVPQGNGTYPFKNAFTYSVNAIFAQVGVALGWDRLQATAERLGFGQAINFTLDTAPTQITNPGSALTKTLLANTAFGQGELLTTPLEMATIAAAIANGGVLASPHLGLSVMDGNTVVTRLEQPTFTRLISADVASTLNDFMVSVVDAGQASGVAVQGVKVAGKTGTAETGSGTSHAWFIAFAPADNPTIAVAVIAEDGGRGSVVAAPIAGAVIKAALAR